MTAATTSLWMVIFSPGSVSRATLEAHVAAAADLMSRHLAPEGGTAATDGGILP